MQQLGVEEQPEEVVAEVVVPMDVPPAAGEGVVAQAARDAARQPAQRARRSGSARRARRRLRSISRTSGTRSGVVQSPSMNDSPMPMSLPVSARRKNRSSWTVSVASRLAGRPRTGTCGRGTRGSAFRRVTPSRPERNAVFAHCVTMLIAPSPNRSDRPSRPRRPHVRPRRHAVRRGTSGTPFHHNRSACQ